MKLSHYLSSADAFLILERAESNEQVITQLTELLTTVHRVPQHKHILKSILDREELGASILPTGVSIPHARCSGIDAIKMVMGLLHNPLVKEHDGNKWEISIFAVFVSPLNTDHFGNHLRLLSQIATFFHDSATVRQLASSNSPAAAFATLKEMEK